MSEVVIRRVEPSDSALLRRVRLRALATDPTSFGSTHEREAAFSDETWIELAGRSAAGVDAATLFAIQSDEPVGIVTSIRHEAQRQLFYVVGMWVAPQARREGVARSLLSGIEEWIASCGGTSAQLSVTNAATAAMRLYESAGYKPDGNSAESRHTPGLIEISFLKQLPGPNSPPTRALLTTEHSMHRRLKSASRKRAKLQNKFRECHERLDAFSDSNSHADRSKIGASVSLSALKGEQNSTEVAP